VSLPRVRGCGHNGNPSRTALFGKSLELFYTAARQTESLYFYRSHPGSHTEKRGPSVRRNSSRPVSEWHEYFFYLDSVLVEVEVPGIKLRLNRWT
jgi:hypothetical protein